ncbi:MAG: hypothetical protein MPJ24_02665 [Pirellulaceae bacterium]|nr:hypothetical protein [Pirellulaceae bacterium]
MISTVISSFGHLSKVHYQNLSEWDEYIGALAEGRLPLGRALELNSEQLLIREMILQLKKGTLSFSYFQEKFGVSIYQKWKDQWDEYANEGFLTIGQDSIDLTRSGYLQVDGLLPPFFEKKHQGVRYT